MEEGFGEAADGFESAALPEAEGALVGGDNEVELHGAVAALSGVVEGVEAHSAGDSAALLGGRGSIAAVGDVGSAAGLVGTEEVGANDLAPILISVFTDTLIGVFRDEDLMLAREPVGESGFAAGVAGESVGFSGADDGFEDGPDRFGVFRFGRADGGHWFDDTESSTADPSTSCYALRSG